MKKPCSQNTHAEFPPAQWRGNGIPWFRLTTLSFGLSLLALASSVSAAPISPEKVSKAVETWVCQVTADKRADATIERLEPYQENGVTRAYIVHLTNGGFCLAGASSLTLPVYFYCPKGVYDPKDPNCQLILKEIAQRHSFLEGEAAKNGAVLKTHQVELSRRARSWEDLAAGNRASSMAVQPQGSPIPQGGPVPLGQPISSGPTELVLPVTSLWNQHPPPYNDYCPTLPEGVAPNNANLTVVGCVATAQAQELYYWKWPNSGVGSGTDTYKYFQAESGFWPYNSLSTPLAANPGIIPDDFTQHLSWSGGQLTMTGWWDGSMYQQAQQFTNGLSANPAYESALKTLYNELTPYSTTLSADFTHTIDWSVMQDRYTYEYGNVDSPDYVDSQIAYLDYELGVAVKMGYGVSESGAYGGDIPGVLTNHFHYDPSAKDTSLDTNQMVLEIQWMRPCLVGGNDHCWMIYGYNMGTSPWQFKMNMGWGGTDNGWYVIDDVASAQLTTPTHIDDFVWNLAPLNVVGFVGASSSGTGSPNTPYQNIQQAIANAPNNATLIFQANSVNTFSGSSLVINTPLTLKGCNVTITK
jgi:hypothetical protein